ncbi:hypothetical protein CCACVL1_07371 [Corchorus capsularis]|uniref:Uncharacterized protein n=1 Tax=Corchorus capsularis TaxID=210143 RepID=A0A1R3J6D6_COCAP|nr:hypothetical protein CCACVL1_07371 [Corchorus capsularis]
MGILKKIVRDVNVSSKKEKISGDAEIPIKREKNLSNAKGSFGNLIQEECLMSWKRSRGRRSASCVICRARWSVYQEKYPNLTTYISQDEAAGDVGDSGGGDISLCAG